MSEIKSRERKNSDFSRVKIGNLDIELTRKKIKNLNIKVLPPEGSVCVSAPLKMSENSIREIIGNSINWIEKQKKHFSKQLYSSPQKIISGELHYIWGKQYQLNVVEYEQNMRSRILLTDNTLELHLKKNMLLEDKKNILENYYRFDIKKQIEKLLPYWESIIGVSTTSFGVKKMKTRWGSCNTLSKKIWLNLDLSKKPLQCLEYVLVHELVHLIEPSHNQRFKRLMDCFLLDWRERRKQLNEISVIEGCRSKCDGS